ncbi:tRNA (uracil) methyltransferase NDAI_0E03180 [Naumovozyma dairenensis CBS 421]|uniref:tRNA (uracil-O(2)-)-methyltransferase n=1 Tax=Naumovozyma dairenensis (strain ATCC 10597 / BCRC 20456 / CBS 421 / NBRC 0211 / NRRL Y-12639) TaxID=1071378 RepID=G0WBL5_NAUDC|nr:hypothetical protein NDAI_0E03180 [Naumovozyma dairenensis CBS 421]CCD25135.1 hypothetical protein NDAI_0E03180 [Naumovozyma dairenensis CBS 421]
MTSRKETNNNKMGKNSSSSSSSSSSSATGHNDGFKFIINEKSILGGQWLNMYTTTKPVEFGKEHFERAMTNLIREPNINSTAILRADILREITYDQETTPGTDTNDDESELKILESKIQNFEITEDLGARTIGIDDITPRHSNFKENDLNLILYKEFVRRIIPRNPSKDALINQTCLIMNSSSEKFKNSTSLIIYTPHVEAEDDYPFYIPRVKSVGILLHEKILTVHYLPFQDDIQLLQDESQRVVRTAYRLLQTSYKHSKGVMQGYEKRVNHDQVVDKVKFQDRYILLKKKYSKFLVDNWAESTDPKKHVFEDIAIAAFLIELWIQLYPASSKNKTESSDADDDEYSFKNKMQFRDLGCGNGVLCYILISEGIKGIGIDARRRKSWSIFPQEVRNCLKEQVIIPSVLLRPHPEVKKRAPHLEHNGRMFPVKVSHELIAPATLVYSSADLLASPQVNVAEFPSNTFIIGNHSDELTCWIPLLGYPFMVIPCCSHNLSGQRVRFYPRKKVTDSKNNNNNNNKKVNTNNSSTYAGLVDHVEYIASRVGWDISKEMLRIPSTRNAAVIGSVNPNLGNFPTQAVYESIIEDSGHDSWVENTMALLKRSPRNH